VNTFNPKYGKLIQFEYLVLPLKTLSLSEYEQRIKKLAYVDSNDMEVVSLKQLRASFGDHPVFGPFLNDKDSIILALLTDDFFVSSKNKYANQELYDEEEGNNSFDDLSMINTSRFNNNRNGPDQEMKLSVPRLMLLGLLYTASSAKKRAEVFFELVQSELDSTIKTDDEEFWMYFPLMVILALIVMPKYYN
jgi:hypothetical protein